MRPAIVYGLTCGTGIAAPLLAGALTGRAAAGATAALGALLVALAQLEGPYGARARILLRQSVLVAAGAGLGGLLGGWGAWSVPVVGALGAVAVLVRVIGIPPVIAVIVGTATPPPPDTQITHILFTLAGGLWVSSLLLSPWPFRRLRPLREALAEARGAVVQALTVAVDAPEEEWAPVRLEAATALADARTAVAMAEGRSPEAGRLVGLYTRVFHEAAAIRGLTAAVPPTTIDWRERLEDAVVRLARALDSGAEVDDAEVDAAEAAVSRFTDRSRRIRRAGLAGTEELPAAVLTGQLRRCVERIGVAVRTAAAIKKVTAPIGLPSIDVRGAWRDRPDRPDRPDRATLRHAGRQAVALVVGMLLVLWVDPEHGQWFVITVLIGLQQTYGDTVDHVITRVAGTAGGATLAAAVLLAIPGQVELSFILMGFAVAAFAMRSSGNTRWTLLITPVMLVLSDFSTPLGWEAAAERILLTLGGGVLALLAARFLWPRGTPAELPGRLAGLLAVHADLVRELAELSDGHGDKDRLTGRFPAAAAAADRLRDALDRMDKEPGHFGPWRLRDAITEARRIRDQAMTLSAVLQVAGNEPSGGRRIADSGPAPAILDAVADRLEASADAVRAGRPGRPVHELKDLVTDLDARVERLADRRLDEVADIEPDRYTPVRRALMHEAGAAEALRNLTVAATRLCDYGRLEHAHVDRDAPCGGRGGARNA